MNIRTLIVDDDVVARQRLRALIETTTDLTLAGECVDGRDAVDVIRTSAVDLVFLDVEMPRLDGFGVIAEIGVAQMPTLIFTSAYSEYAIRAFESYALDYLLKPFADSRFSIVVERARQQVADHRARATVSDVTVDARLVSLAGHFGRANPPAYHDAIAIKTGSEYDIVRVADIDWIEADGNYSRLYVHQRPRILTKTLAVLEREVLDPAVFVRVHRSAIVNCTKIAGVEGEFHGQLTLVLQGGARVPCSRRFRHVLEQRLYFTT